MTTHLISHSAWPLTGAAVIAVLALPAQASLAARSHDSPLAIGTAAVRRTPELPPPPVAGGTLTVTLEPVVFGASDGLPGELLAGREYVAVVPIWVTPGAKNPQAHFSLADGRRPTCKNTALNGGVVTRVRCTFVAGKKNGTPGGSDSTLSVVVKIAAYRAHKDYPHTAIAR